MRQSFNYLMFVFFFKLKKIKVQNQINKNINCPVVPPHDPYFNTNGNWLQIFYFSDHEDFENYYLQRLKIKLSQDNSH